MKYAWIDGQRKTCPLPVMCRGLAVSVSGYRAWKRGGARPRHLTNAHMLALIRTIHAQHKGTYGSPRMTTGLVLDALAMAWFRRKPAAGVMHHSNRGSQYASQAHQQRLKTYGMTCSMSRKGHCWDNAPTESFFNSLNTGKYFH